MQHARLTGGDSALRWPPMIAAAFVDGISSEARVVERVVDFQQAVDPRAAPEWTPPVDPQIHPVNRLLDALLRGMTVPSGRNQFSLSRIAPSRRKSAPQLVKECSPEPKRYRPLS